MYVTLRGTTPAEFRYGVETSRVTSTPTVGATSAQTPSFITTAGLLVRASERMPPASVSNRLCSLGLGPPLVARVSFDVDSGAVECTIDSPRPKSLAAARDRYSAEMIVQAKWPGARSKPGSGNTVSRTGDTSSPALAISVLQHGVPRLTRRKPTPIVQDPFEPSPLVPVALPATEPRLCLGVDGLDQLGCPTPIHFEQPARLRTPGPPPGRSPTSSH